MAELIYNIKNLFSIEKEGCLLDYESNFYHIASYQRGYKWGSDENGAVSILLKDLKEAFQKSENNKTPIDFYLQYITLKKIDKFQYLEVIDGQQRLTTLSILLAVFSSLLETVNIASNKLDYAVRSNFFKDYIYPVDNLKEIFHMSWDRKVGLALSNGPINTQDVFYIFSAIQKCHQFLSSLPQQELKLFYEFVLQNVLVIVNVVEHISSEKVFSNLNSNKVALTESELVKALFITKFARLNDTSKSKTFREIQERRLILGRRWDEVENWVNRKEVKAFYFSHYNSPMFGFLSLVAKSFNYKQEFPESSNRHELFNFFNDQDITKIQQNLYNIFWMLKDWYEDTEVYNKLGYLFFHKGSQININEFVEELNHKSKQAFQRRLLERIILALPTELEDINYENSKEVHQVLLALNVFASDQAFDFYSYNNENWTLEHIFPQSPFGKNKKLQTRDKDNILSILKPEDRQLIKDVLENDLLTVEDKEIFNNALRGSGLIHHLGNMCLLSNLDNISNGCAFYDEKRSKILKRLQSGGFIPSHTIEVFTKSIFNENPDDFTRWTKDNISDHGKIIIKRIKELNAKLITQSKHESG